jgi:tetratricopeptide (TPR) repeat protein
MSEVDRALGLYDESTALESAGDLAGAEAKCREAIAIFEREEGPSSPDVANLPHSLGLILEREGKFQESAECAWRAADIIEPLVPAFDGPDGKLILIHSFELLGTALRQMGAYAEAEPPLARAIELAESLPDQPETLVKALNNFGVLCKFAGSLSTLILLRILQSSFRPKPKNPQLGTFLRYQFETTVTILTSGRRRQVRPSLGAQSHVRIHSHCAAGRQIGGRDSNPGQHQRY